MPGSMKNSHETKETITALLQQQQLAVLSTTQESRPYASLIAYYASSDLKKLYFVTPTSTRKYANLVNQPEVALLINNSINRPEDFHDAAAVTVIGSAAVVDSTERQLMLPHYLGKHPYLHEFANSPSCEMIRVDVERYIMVQRFQNVTEYRVENALDTPT